MGKLDPELGGGGVEFSEVGFTKEEAKANWEAFKVQIKDLKPGEDFKKLWEAVKAQVEALIAKLPV